jgi:hypothetical protein
MQQMFSFFHSTRQGLYRRFGGVFSGRGVRIITLDSFALAWPQREDGASLFLPFCS